MIRAFQSACFVLAVMCSAVALRAEEIRFAQDIRPLLSDKCFACHGPDEEHREGGLRLDLQANAFGQADSEEPIITPGKPDESLLIARITSTDESLRMPPAETNKPLSADPLSSTFGARLGW